MGSAAEGPPRGLPDNRKLTKLYDLTALEDTWLFDSGL